MNAASAAPSQFVWYELMTTDAPAAERFYAAVTGWKMQDAGMPGYAYTILSVGETSIGGLMALPPEARAAGVPPHWVGYIGVADVDATTERVRAAGGAVRVEPTDIPGVGRFSSVADPQGAGFVLFKGASDAQPVAPPFGTPGHIGWHELYASELDGAFAFYAELFGWTKDTAVDMGPMGIYQLFAAGGPAIGGMMKKPAEMPVTAWQYYINVDDIDAGAERIRAAGGRVLMGPHEVPGGSWIVSGMDPQGAFFALLQPPR